LNMVPSVPAVAESVSSTRQGNKLNTDFRANITVTGI